MTNETNTANTVTDITAALTPQQKAAATRKRNAARKAKIKEASQRQNEQFAAARNKVAAKVSRSELDKTINTFLTGAVQTDSKQRDSIAELGFKLFKAKSFDADFWRSFCEQSGAMSDSKRRNEALRDYMIDHFAAYAVLQRTKNEIGTAKSSTDPRAKVPFELPGYEGFLFTFKKLTEAIGSAQTKFRLIVSVAVACANIKRDKGHVALRSDKQLEVRNEKTGGNNEPFTASQATNAFGSKAPGKGTDDKNDGQTTSVTVAKVTNDLLFRVMNERLIKNDTFADYTASEQEHLINIHTALIGMMNAEQKLWNKASERVAGVA